jgi:hypothetical protein
MFVCLMSTSLAFAAPPDAPKSQNEYVAKLTAADTTADAQFRLSTWARKQGMADVADGHLRAAVHIDPRHEAAQKAMGRGFRDGRWESKDERASRLEEEKRLQAEFALWQGRIKEHGLDALTGRPLTDAAIAAVEQFAAQDERRSLAAIRIFGDCQRGASTLALVRWAVASPFAEVRLASAKALQERNPDHYLFELLDYVRPQRAGKQVVLGLGEIWRWQEGATAFAAVHPIDNGENVGAAAAALLPNYAPVPREPQGPPRPKFRVDPGSVESAHARAQEIRANAVAALQTTTGREISDDFDAWRGAVMAATGMHVDGGALKPNQYVDRYYQPDVTAVGGNMMRLKASCFAAGTPVVAKRGEVPIDQVCLGELVLSRNMETGETAYKPVLARTLRPRIPMQKLAIGGETFLATAGHPFWTSEKGWVKAKNLAKNAWLVTEAGAVRVDATGAAEEPQQAYNLVVADFGTYFVGKSRVLVHDNTPIREAK